MNIININSSIEITPSQESFIKEVLLSDDHHVHGMLEKDSFYRLSKEIPIFLINERTMKKYDNKMIIKNYIENERHYYEEKETYVYEPNEATNPPTEWLGFYERDTSGLFEHTPRIAICPERIAACVKSYEKFTLLLAKVIVHELAHAKMDFEDQSSQYGNKDNFFRWMEEASANRYTLQIFENFTYKLEETSFENEGQKIFNFIVNFIKKQPPEYALGYQLFKKRPILDWEWERAKDKLGGRKQEKHDFLNYVTKNYKNIDDKKFEFLFESVIDNKKASNDFAKQKLEEKISKNDPNITQEDLEDIFQMNSLFDGVTKLAADISKWDVSKVVDMSYMFKYSTINPNISDWNVSNVTDMRYMFAHSKFDGDISKWDVFKVENMGSMFEDSEMSKTNLDKLILNWYFNPKGYYKDFCNTHYKINSYEDIKKIKSQLNNKSKE